MKMLSILLVAAALGQCAAVRPERLGAKVVSQVATIADLLEPVRAMAHSTRPIDRLAAFKAANGIVNKILLQSGNATKHMSESEQELLQKVVDLMESSIYASMDSSHKADESALGAAISDIEKCSSDIANRLAATGDLGRMHQSVRTKQSDLNDLQAVVDEKTAANTSAWEAFALHMSLIANPPEVPSFPARTMGALDVYFEKSPFCLWFTQQQEAYVVKRDAFVAADKALKEAIAAYDVKKAMRDVQYCDWKTELEEGCGAFEDCYSTKSDFYTKELKPRVTTDMQARIENFKAGETLVQQIKFLLAKSTSRETPTVDSSRYEVDFPAVPDQGTCDLSPLTSSEWVPTVTCKGTEPEIRTTRVACEWRKHRTHRDCTMTRRGTCYGKVKYGHGDKWTEWREMFGDFDCSNRAFGDPNGGQAKECICEEDVEMARDKKCWENGFRWTPLNMAGASRSVSTTVKGCQERCASTTGCKHFSFWHDGGCHLQDGRAKRHDHHAVSGPPSCV